MLASLNLSASMLEEVVDTHTGCYRQEELSLPRRTSVVATAHERWRRKF